ncbi:MAG TPA: hypothetical protein PLX97_05105 [Gemmatales bacterium]|nr:hypothetical protein [Gemmatales bacterium]
MKVRTRVANPNEVEVTLQLTLTVKEWGQIRSKFLYGTLEPAQSKFADAIGQSIARISAILEEEVPLLEEVK